MVQTLALGSGHNNMSKNMHIQGDDKSLTLGAKLDVDREGCLLVFKRHQKPTTVHAFSDKINFQQNISIVGFSTQQYIILNPNLLE